MLTLVCFDNITEFITLDSVNGKCRRWKRVDLPPFSPLPTPVILNSTASGKTKGHIEYCLLAEDHSMVAWPSPSTDRYKLQTSFFSTEIPAALEPPPTAGTGTNGSLQILPFFPFPRHPRSGRRRQREIYGRQAQEKDCRCCCCSPRPRQWQPPCTESVGGGRERGEYGTLYMCASLGQSHPTQVMDVSKRARPGRGGAAGAGKRWHCITWPTGPGFVFFPEGRGWRGGCGMLTRLPLLGQPAAARVRSPSSRWTAFFLSARRRRVPSHNSVGLGPPPQAARQTGPLCGGCARRSPHVRPRAIFSSLRSVYGRTLACCWGGGGGCVSCGA